MTIDKSIANGSVCMALTGRLDTVTAPELERELKDALDGATELVLDFEKLDYISSSGLRVLLSAQKALKRPGAVKVTHVNEAIREIFDMTGFSEILTIE